MTTKVKLEAGQTLWFVPDRHYGRPHEVVVEKIGRKWARVVRARHDRIDVETLIMYSGDSRTGVCYLSEDDWKVQQAAQELWNKIAKGIWGRYNKPRHVTAEQIKQAAELLGVDLT